MAAYFILEEVLVIVFDGIGIVGEESERRHRCRDLRHEFDLHRQPARHRWRIVFDLFQHDIVQLRRWYFTLPVVEYVQSFLHRLEDALFFFG